MGGSMRTSRRHITPGASSSYGARTGMDKVKLGLLRLTDAAPLIVAKELGTFAEEGLDVELSIEPSWANVADKIVYGLLDGAVMLPPLALAVTLGLRGGGAPLVVPMSLSLKGNTITLSESIAAEILRGDAPPDARAAARRLAALIGAGGGGSTRPALAVVHGYSTHNLLLRYWLAAGGLDPDRDVELTVVPGVFIAARGGIGRTVAVTSEIWNNHPEKVLALGRRWAEENLNRVQRLLRALLRAARYCDDAANASRIAVLVAETLALDPTAVLASLPGAASRAPQGVPRNADVSTFFANTATFPWRSHALWFLREMARWGYVDPGLDAAAVAASVYRPDLYRDAAHAVGAPVPVADMKAEGEHAGDWTLAAAPAPVAMGADRFCDGAVFDPNTRA